MAKPKVLIRIDINEDGDFNDANEDVTSDVRSFKFVGGKRVQKHRVEPSILEFVLNNDDHKYSPSKSTGVWFPFVKLSPIVWLMMGYPVDDFVAADGTDLDGRKPSHDANWPNAWAFSVTSFQVDTNKLKPLFTSIQSATIQMDVDMFVGVKFTRNGSNAGLILRRTGPSDFLLVRSDGTTLYLSKVASGTMTTVASAAHTWTAGDEKFILVEMHGDFFRVAVDDVLVISENNGGVTSFNNASDHHGIGGFLNNTSDRWSDFGGWRSIFYGRIDTVQPRPIHARQYAHIRALDDMERLSKHFVYRTAPTAPVWGDDILGEILDGANFSATNRILSPPDSRASEVTTVSATGSATFQLDDTGQKFRDWMSGQFLVKITDASGTTALGWIGTSDVDGDGTRVELYTTSDLATLGYAKSDTGFDETDTPLTYNVIWRPLTEDADSVSALGRDALTEAYQVADDDVGQFFIDGSGFARYEQYLHRIPSTGRHATSLDTWFASRQSGAETDIYFADVIWDDGKDRVENEAFYKFHKINLAVAAQVWRLHPDDIPFIKNGTAEIVFAFGEGDIIANPRTPLWTNDYSLNSASGGGGTDLLIAEASNSGTVAASGSTAFTLDDTSAPFIARYRNGKHQVLITDASGTRAFGYIGTADTDGDNTKVALFKEFTLTTLGYTWSESGFDETDTPLTFGIYNVTTEIITGFDGNFRSIRLYNGSGTDGFLHFLQLFAQKGTKANESVARGLNDESQTFVGRRRIELTTLHIDKFLTAQQRAKARIGERSIPRERVQLQMFNSTAWNLFVIIHRQMSDQVNLDYNATMGINGHYWVERKTIEMNTGNALVQADIELTSVDTWLAGSSTNGARAGLARAR